MDLSLRIAIADDEPDMREYLQKVLPRLGHEVVATAADGRQLIERCAQSEPDLVITDIRMPVMDGIEAATEIFRRNPIPVVLISAFNSADLIERAEGDHIMAYLVKPIKQADLQPAIALAVRRFQQLENVKSEVAVLQQKLEDRKLIERAKGVLMRLSGLNEAEAFMRLQRLSNDKNMKLIDVAKHILTAEDAIRD